ncbi:hypothetical protein AALP_AA8G489500 [Arabis alpina]|uniref:Uncharacterized protein n=1 Tax=Arabis alpina TaxID=50452 RepID=A0A087GED0_ARAAL|nr:hypothetical protein AALP_AA8G489500 [Arabis alpina]
MMKSCMFCSTFIGNNFRSLFLFFFVLFCLDQDTKH